MARFDRRQFLRAIGAASIASVLGPHIAATQSRAADLDDLAARLTGRLVRASEPDFHAVPGPRTLRFARDLPLAVARCETPGDVAACISWAARTATPLAVSGGQHNYEGYCTGPGLVISTRPMNRISADLDAGAAEIQAGALNGELMTALRGSRWMLPIGTCPNVGVTGLLLGGGIGNNARWAGITADHLRSVTIALASGDLVTATPDSDADLFWACQGGGGSIGVVTSFTAALVEIPRQDIIVWEYRHQGAEYAAAAFAAYESVHRAAPPELAGISSISSIPPSPGRVPIPASRLRDPRFVPGSSTFGCFIGSRADATDLIAPIAEAGPAYAGEVTELPFRDAQFDWLATPPRDPHSWDDYARFAASDLPDDAAARIFERILDCPVGDDRISASFQYFGWVGGATQAAVAADATAFPHRNVAGIIHTGITWMPDAPADQVAAAAEWLEDAVALVDSITAPSAFVNWPNRRFSEYADAYWGANLPRLSAVKARVDPDGLFSHPQSIPLPGAAG
ncbi:MAG: FAD-binding oxidoreductase [Chloroflexota bacterium]